MDVEKYRKGFGKRLEVLMEKRGISERELGEKIGTSGQTIHAYKKGRATPTFDKLVSIAVILGASVDWLLCRSGFTGRWELYNGEGACKIWRCSRCGNKVGPLLKDRIYCEKCGSKNGGNYDDD